MDPSSSTSFHAETSSRRPPTSLSHHHAWNPQTNSYNSCRPTDLPNGQNPTFTDPWVQASTDALASSSSLGISSDSSAQKTRTHHLPLPITIDQQQQSEANLSDVSATDQTAEDLVFSQWLQQYGSGTDFWDNLLGIDGQPCSEAQTSHTAVGPSLGPPTDSSTGLSQPDVVHNELLSVSTNSSMQSRDSSAGYPSFLHPSSQSFSLTGNYTEHAGSYTSGSSDFLSGESSWNQQSFKWPPRHPVSDTTSSQDDNTQIAQQRQQPQRHAQLPQRSQSQPHPRQPQAHPKPQLQQQQQNTQLQRAQQSQVTDSNQVSQPEGAARLTLSTAPLYVYRPPHPPFIDSPMISPLSMPSGSTFQAQQADAMSYMNAALQARPTLARSRRRSAVYYKHGRTVADTSIEVLEEARDSPVPDVGSRNRTSSCGPTLQTRKHLGDITNRSHSVSGPLSRTQLRKQSGPVGKVPNNLDSLAELPVAMSNLAWADTGSGSCGAGGDGQQRNALNLLDKLREGLRNEVTPQPSSLPSLRKGSAQSK